MSDGPDQVTRRKLLIGAGAVTAFSTIALSPSKAAAADTWDREADIVVVGSGAGATTAAIVAHEAGSSVVMLEKAPIPGGTSARSAGVMWIPDNFTLRAKGIRDEKADCLRYMARFSYPERYAANLPMFGLNPRAYALLEAFYDNASAMIDRLRENGSLTVAEWRMFALDRPATDYLDQVPENKVPAGRPLGPVRDDGQMGLGGDLMAQLGRARDKRQIPLLLGHRAMRLIVDSTGRVIGVEAESAGKTVRLRGRKGVIFATGGYVHNTELVDTYQRNRLYGSCAASWATGDFIPIAGAAGASMGNLSGAWRTQVVLEEALQSSKMGAGVFYTPGDSMLQVNRHGKRVVNEHRNYNDRTEAHGFFDPSAAEFPNELLFMIYDRRTAEAFAGAYPLPATPAGAAHVLSSDDLGGLAAAIAARLGELAPRTGGFSLSPAFAENLEATIARFNGFARSGVDLDFQRGAAAYDREWHAVFSPMQPGASSHVNSGPNPTMHPFAGEGPYFAIMLAAGALDTNGGPQIDASARVLDTRDRPIPGLYGAGNCIASPSRFAYFGAGHTLALTMTFGYIAANAAHREMPAESA
ncbi:MAG TPA: FAD-dependent oxidoreductase [Steroidobacteraceae bacterium]|nr:FAD-dependent oxidoreductase [Steroidobacteraceae bacterium]